MKVAAVLLAAGSASRFGSDKLQHRLTHGVPIAIQSARHLRKEIEQVVAVVRPGSEELQKAFAAEGVRSVVCDRADEGMGTSLACGIKASEIADAYLIALADMPFIRPSSIEAVRDALTAGAALVAPYFRARRGHPVGIAASFRSEMEQLTGDEGAKRILAKHADKLVKIPVGDPGVVRDIDKPSDLAPPLVV
ncbi:MAG TPA: nucleotidyltransferase family protein [Burkholderiales bacterium]|nr:nucleotidyltransferase family protein [Burkholderiales bacterium]